ncbi:MAG: helix-turn-helix domain-containing protein [Clostridiales bacterium]|nr:helix-turn-helix domain-containing protein [Clostridiales bacterium]
MNISQAVAERIRELLKQKNLTQYKLEQKACVSHETLKSIMKGKAKGVNLRTLIAVADGLDMTVSQFLDSRLFLYDNLNLD